MAAEAGPHLADAIADPRTVVVELADAVVADGAVRAARRAVVVAGVAPLRAHREAVHVELLRLHAPARQAAPRQRSAPPRAAPFLLLMGNGSKLSTAPTCPVSQDPHVTGAVNWQ